MGSITDELRATHPDLHEQGREKELPAEVPVGRGVALRSDPNETTNPATKSHPGDPAGRYRLSGSYPEIERRHFSGVIPVEIT